MRGQRSGFLPLTLAALALLAGCGRSDAELQQRLTARYTLQWTRENPGLRHPDARSSALDLRGDGRFTQDCVDAAGNRTDLAGRWQLARGWVEFDSLLDCVGAWPAERAPDGRLQLARLHFAIERPLIVVSSELNALYVGH